MPLRSAALALTIAALVIANAAHAGYRFLIPVFINDSSRFAYGSMDGAQRSADGVQYLGCMRQTFNVYCFAMNDAGLMRSCTTSDPTMMQVVRTMSSKSYVQFYWDAAGNCTSILTAELSYSQN